VLLVLLVLLVAVLSLVTYGLGQDQMILVVQKSAHGLEVVSALCLEQGEMGALQKIESIIRLKLAQLELKETARLEL